MNTNVDLDPSSSEKTLEPFVRLIGAEFVEFIFERAPRKVASRVSKALDHFSKAMRLTGVDEEMGAIRCIAAEEELVVAIFEVLKLNAANLPAHEDFIRRYKNHYVKLSFHPVLSQFRWILSDMIRNGITFPGWENLITMRLEPVVDEGRVKLRMHKEDGQELVALNPLNVSISCDDLDHEDVVEELFRDFEAEITRQSGMTVRQFITARAEFRNTLLYATDAGYGAMADRLDELIERSFSVAYRDLLWALAILLDNKPAHRNWGLVSQFIGLYRRVLSHSKLI
ncbi:hypothetical protein QA640_09880 [Bradyrhizobium sp. CB82]|uniref:hypothetical protein n=1 Tax=Bradyrhizobium sp. CB82 TaxID=3039159 RepID=UPI0024B03E96|nr:hypothetical protein [Bradyrhizobium sp. CB82]WFU42737.1 hypothetical protein QA640_09880 [Bradyrhizobium sp. CB82]